MDQKHDIFGVVENPKKTKANPKILQFSDDFLYFKPFLQRVLIEYNKKKIRISSTTCSVSEKK